MSYFSSSQILNYAECPARSYYQANPKLFDTREAITAYLVGNLLKHLISEAQNGKVLSEEKANKELNILWSKIHKKITFKYSPNDMIIFQSYIKRLMLHFYGHEKIEVLVSDQNFEYQIEDNVITIPLSVFRVSSSVYVYYIDMDIFVDDTPVGYTFIEHIVYRLGREICKGHTYAMKPVIYRAQTLRTYQCIDNSRVDNALDSMMQSMTKVFYPRITDNCKFCNRKESCRWYEQKTN